jgi:hypothetical protein
MKTDTTWNRHHKIGSGLPRCAASPGTRAGKNYALGNLIKSPKRLRRQWWLGQNANMAGNENPVPSFGDVLTTASHSRRYLFKDQGFAPKADTKAEVKKSNKQASDDLKETSS